MEILWILIPIALLLGLFFVLMFIYTVKSGQYDDLETPAYKMLLNDNLIKKGQEK